MATTKHTITDDLIEEIAECIYLCDWKSAEEVIAYMKGVIKKDYYDPEEWAYEGQEKPNKILDMESK